MKNKFLRFPILLVWLVLVQILLLNDWSAGQNHQHKQHDHTGHHEAHHGGVLNVIDKCEVGHIEVRIESDLLESWFVGGGNDTHRSVPIVAEEITLNVTFANGGKKTLLLKADPMKLAGETSGYCSRFSARADWLTEVKEFEAHGQIMIKGVQRTLIIKYPEGYDPGHSTE